MNTQGAFTIKIHENDYGKRLDLFLSSQIPECTRSQATNLIKKGVVKLNELTVKPGYKIKPGDLVTGSIPPPTPISALPEKIDLNIVYEDEDIIVINKQAGLVVHPAPGNYSGTLVNGLLYHCPDLKGIGGKTRPGIVHRLDKDTTGLMVVAKNQVAHNGLSIDFKERNIEKKYLAVVSGVAKEDSGIITFPIGRHRINRKKMSISSNKSRTAESHWKVVESYKEATLLEFNIKTGRTHQIRVHSTAINHPIIGDPLYGKRKKNKTIKQSNKINNYISTLTRQMLHSNQLEFIHPVKQKRVSFKAPVHNDMEVLIELLRKNL